MGKIASVVYLLAFFSVSFFQGDPGTLLPTAVFALLPLVLIWFSEELGAWLEARGYLKVARPALWLQRLGWVLFALMPVFVLV